MPPKHANANANAKRSREPHATQDDDATSVASETPAERNRRLAELFEQRAARSTAIGKEVTEDLESRDPFDVLDELADRWELDNQTASVEDFTRLAMENFKVPCHNDIDLNAPGEFGLRALDEEIERHEQQAIKLFNTIKIRDPGGERPDAQIRAAKVIEMVYYAKRLVLSAFQARLGIHQLHSSDVQLADDLDMLLGSWTLRYRWINMSKSTPLQKLLMHLLDYAMEKRYRKHNGCVYEPIVVNGYETHAWRQVCEIKEFVYAATQKEMHWEQWEHLTASGNNARMAIEHLSNSNDYQFRFLVKDRSVFSFRNGVYVARDDRFYRFAPGAEPLSDSVVSAKFFDADFDTFADLPDWRAIPTPNLQRIMDYQEWPSDVCDWMYISLGRLLYSVGERDGWQIIPFMHGSASSGKCMAFGTPVLMHDGSVKPVQHVRVGDALMGDDGGPRLVLSLARGIDDMVTLRPRRPGYPEVTVTADHVLCLQHTHWRGKGRVRRFMGADDTVEMTVREYMALPRHTRDALVCYRVPVEKFSAAVLATEEDEEDAWVAGHACASGLRDELPLAVRAGSRAMRMAALAGMVDACAGVDTDTCSYVLMVRRKQQADDAAFLARSLGFGAAEATRPCHPLVCVAVFGPGLQDLPVRTWSRVLPRAPSLTRADACTWAFDAVPAGRQDYYGFMTDGNQRFLLGDFTCTHNSTISLKVAKLFYEHADVGVLSNNIERQFGLSAFWDKLLFVGPEIKSDLKVEQAEFQSIVSGESVQISAKHRKAFTVEWDTPGILAGNEVPAFSDNAGSVQRRFLVFSFLKAVLNGDMRLAEKLAAEMPAILVKCNRAYLEASDKWGSRNIWTVLPDYFHKTRDEMAQAVNSIEAFLASSEVTRDPAAYCPLRAFKDSWKAFAVRNGYRVNIVQDSHFRTPFDKFGLSIEKGTVREYAGARRNRDWVLGVDLVTEDGADCALG